MKKTAQQKSIKYKVSSIKQKGFSLVEILVAITIFATLVGGVILSLNPLGQINKGQDAKRMSDLQSIKAALEIYYSDNKCYPQSGEMPFGQQWSNGNAVYMKEVPQDPNCNEGNGTCYRYRTEEGDACPQWNVVFAQLSQSSALTNTCPLSSLSSCTPEGYGDAQWACTLSGAVNCSGLSTASLLGGIETVLPTSTPTPGPTATPTPVPPPPDGSSTFATLDSGSNPDAYEVTIMPLYEEVGSPQSIRILADDATSNIVSLQVILYSDGDAKLFTLTRVGGTAQDGMWEGTWEVTDTYNQIPEKHYGYDIITTNALGSVDNDYIRIPKY